MKHISLLLVFLFGFQWLSGQIAPDFTITNTDGIETELYADYLDRGVIVVIKMFFVDCPLCKPYNAPFQSLYEEFGEGSDSVEFLLLTTKPWDSNEEVGVYREMHNLTFPGSGNDGGGYQATEPYRNGDFGQYFGSPSFLLIEPNGKLHLDMAGSSVANTMDNIRQRINTINNGGTAIDATQVDINVESHNGNDLPGYEIYLQSTVHSDSFYAVPASFIYPSEDYPLLENPAIVVKSDEINHSGITTIDIVVIQRYILSINPLDNIQVMAADVNGSGSITPSDLLSMRKVILSLKDEFNVGRSWLGVDERCLTDVEYCKESVSLDTSLSEQTINFKLIKFGDVK